MLYSVEENLDLMDSEQVDQIIEELISDSDREWWLMREGVRWLRPSRTALTVHDWRMMVNDDSAGADPSQNFFQGH